MVDLRAQIRAASRAEVDAADGAASSRAHTSSAARTAAAFEQEFAAYCGAAHACGVANGTDALTVALRAYGIGPGDEVVTVANTFIATGEAILLNGARPVFVDVDAETFTMDPARIEGAITPTDEADPAGAPLRASRRHERDRRDRRAATACRSSRTRPRPTGPRSAAGAPAPWATPPASASTRERTSEPTATPGSWSRTTATSSTACAEIANHGGVQAVRAPRPRDQQPPRHAPGRGPPGQAPPPGPRGTRERRERVAAYDAALSDVPHVRASHGSATAVRSAWHLYTVRVAERDALRAELERQGVATAVHYPRPIHLQPAMAPLGGKEGDLPISEQLSREVLSLPLYPELPLETVARIASHVRASSATPTPRRLTPRRRSCASAAFRTSR